MTTNKILKMSLPVYAALSTLLALPQKALAACGDPSGGIDSGINCSTSPLSVPQAIGRVTDLLLYIIGIAAVIMLIVGGMRYVLSGGDPKNTQAAKDTILYAVIGIVVALLAYAIVKFVLSQFS